jgi:hypothetical protein
VRRARTKIWETATKIMPILLPAKVTDQSKSGTEKVKGGNLLISCVFAIEMHHCERHDPRAEKCQIDGGTMLVPGTYGVTQGSPAESNMSGPGKTSGTRRGDVRDRGRMAISLDAARDPRH